MPLDKLSVSSASLFKSCPRMYYQREVLGWEPAVKAAWLGKGSAYDKLLEIYDLEGVAGANSKIPEIFPDPFEAVDARYLLSKYHTAFGHEPYPPCPGGNQHGFGVVYRGSEISGPLEFKITGYIDKVSQRGDELLVVERKTVGGKEEDASLEEGSPYWKKLKLDPQIRAYVWYLRSQGNNCGWVVYEVLRKLSSTVNKAFKKDCSLEDYIARLSTHNEKKTLVARRLIFVTEEMCDEFANDHALVYKDILETKLLQKNIETLGYDGKFAYVKHENSCKSYGGCPYKEVCEGSITCEQGDFIKSAKWKKANA